MVGKRTTPETSHESISCLEWLKRHSIVVADTGDFEAIKKFHPEDATTNPTLLLQAAQLPQYAGLLDDAMAYGKKAVKKERVTDAVVDAVCIKLAVNFGAEILKVVPGLVSTEVNADLSFDTDASVGMARQIIALYKEMGIDKSRVLIKMATTWEGCEAAKILEKEGIHCNMTLLFSKAQAMAAGQVGATLISPFVGRIFDWHVNNCKLKSLLEGKTEKDAYKVEAGENDPGVKSVTSIFENYRANDYKTVVMGASFRNIDQIKCLAGCDKLTISPKLLTELEKEKIEASTPPKLQKSAKKQKSDAAKPLTQSEYRLLLNGDAMATEKLAEGIRGFRADLDKLKTLIRSKLDTAKSTK